MLFYRIYARKTPSNTYEHEQRSMEYTDEINRLYDGKVFVAIEEISELTCNLVVIINHEILGDTGIEDIVDKYNKISGLELSIKSYEEISAQIFNRALRRAENKKYIDDRDKIMSEMKTDCDCRYKEYIVKPKSREKIEEISKDLLYDNSFLPEIERIYQSDNANGQIHHPVHYIVHCDNDDYKDIVPGLVSALYDNKRVASKRYSEVRFDEYTEYSRNDLSQLYNLNQGGTFVVKIDGRENSDSSFSKDSLCDEIEKLTQVFKRYAQNVLTIFVMPTFCEKEADILYKGTSTIFMEISPENVSGERAENYLRHKAEIEKVIPTDSLFEGITADKAFSAAELTEHFATWHAQYIRTEMYPQYALFKKKTVAETDKRFGKALRDLDEMIGLASAKKIIYNALDFYKVQKMYKQFGKRTENPTMHMVFTGNPGTAKTTVARLFAQILKDNDVITNGSLIEVGRADIVGKYVGQTAPLVRRAFNQAAGGVLFIDEAYSLLDGKDGLYGDEAINAIVQEMENRRNETIVIFAGYPKEMENFLAKNPGLKSRIAFTVPFEDYNSDELLSIAKLMAKNKDNSLPDDAVCKLKEIFERVSKTDDFGNGRYVRNIMEKAELNRASRLAKMNLSEVTQGMLERFEKSDFEITEVRKPEKRCIGFTGGTI